MKCERSIRGRKARVLSTGVAVIGLMSSILTIGLQGVSGAATDVGSRSVGTNPLDVVLDHSNTFGYVANFTSSTVSVIQLSNSTVVATVNLGTNGGTNPSRIAIDPTDTYAYVSNAGTNNVSVIQLSTNTWVKNIALPANANPEQIYVNSANTDAYVVDRGISGGVGEGISVIALPADTVTALSTTGLSSPEGIYSNGTDAWVTNRGNNTVSEIVLSTGANVGSPITVGTAPSRIAANPAGTDLYVTNTTSDNVTEIQTSNNAIVGTFSVGLTPDAIAVDPTDTYAYVSNSGASTVSMVQLSTNTVVQSLTVGTAPEGIVVNSAGTYAYVANYSSSTIDTIDIAPHTTTFNGNGSTSGSMATQTSSFPTGLTANSFAKTNGTGNYTFAGWNTLANGTGTAYADGGTYPFSVDATLYAQWNATVTFAGNGATSGTMANELNSKSAALTANSFVRTGYTFSGWNTSADGTGTAYAPGALFPFAVNTTLYAQWTVNPSYTVTFAGNGSTGGSMATETDNAPTALSANAFTRIGFVFSGWNTAANGTGTAYAPGAAYPFTSSATLYAQWTSNTPYTVTFNGNGSTSGTMAAETNNAPTALAADAFVRSGYTFSGWNTAANGTGAAYAAGATYAFTSNTTLYAQWTIIPDTVIFNGNGATSGSMAAETSKVPSALTANSYVRSGYTFSGWNTAANGTGTAYAAGVTFPFSVSTTLYAQWIPIPHPKRVVGYARLGKTSTLTIVGLGFTSRSKVSTSDKHTVIRTRHAAWDRLVILVTVPKGNHKGRYVLTIKTPSRKTVKITYVTK